MANISPVTNLDFFATKTALKTFLKNQDRFADYDFEGSNMNVLLDVLSYNTFYNNYYYNMAISEMFLDSAQEPLMRELDKYGINSVPVQFRHSMTLSGGIHCATLDLRRKGTLESYCD